MNTEMTFMKRYGLENGRFVKDLKFMKLDDVDKMKAIIECNTGEAYSSGKHSIAYTIVNDADSKYSPSIGPFTVDLSVKFEFIRVLTNPWEIPRWLRRNMISEGFADLCSQNNILVFHSTQGMSHYIFMISKSCN
jgi:hypothetical protein